MTSLPRLTCGQRHILRQTTTSRVLARLSVLIAHGQITSAEAARFLAAYRAQVAS